MSKRLQVILGEIEFREIKNAARIRKLTVAAWVRDALRTARKHDSMLDPKKKLAVVRTAVNHSYPTADIDQMIAEIELGYGGGVRQ